MSGSNGWQKRKRIRQALLAADPHCFYCGWPLRLQDSTLDHLVPSTHGGDDDESNLVLCCRPCNQRKGNKPLHGMATLTQRGGGLTHRPT